MRSKRSEEKNCLSSKNVHICLLDSVKRRTKRLGECEIVLIFQENNENEVEASEAKNCLSSKNVNLCLLDSVESIAQGIKIL